MLKIAWSPTYNHPVPHGHRFPMLKYELIPEALLWKGIISPENLFEPDVAKKEDILLTHDAGYFDHLVNLNLDAKHIRRIGFGLDEKLIERELRIVQGSIDCALSALKYGVALNVAGGTHHAFTDKGEGFCLLNDFAVAAHYLRHYKLASRILIIDLDVHQGNGTAQIFKNEPGVFTFSMHAKNNFPFIKETSDCDVELADGTGGQEYFTLLKHHLPELLSAVKPDFVFYLSGVDVLETDKLGKLKLTINDCKQRDEFVFGQCHAAGLPVAVAMGGGYSPEISDIVEAHCNTFMAASEIFFR
ncbi:MAG: histone deacetylase [Bacteroidota bacterium]